MDMIEICWVLFIGALAGAIIVVMAQFFSKKFDGNKSYDFKLMVEHLNKRNPAARTKFLDMYYLSLKLSELCKVQVMLEHTIRIKTLEHVDISEPAGQDNPTTGRTAYSQNGSLSDNRLRSSSK